MALRVDVDTTDFDDAPESRIRDAALHVLRDHPVEAAELSLTLLDDSEIRRLNREYLARDRVTDVIAFSLGEDGGPLVGDVYVGYEQARRQAAEHGVDVDEEVLRLAIHGVLHVLGHDHPEGAKRVSSPMFRLQERLLAEVLGAA